MFSLMRSPHIFFNLINQPAPWENGDGDVLRPSPVHQLSPHSSAVDVTDPLWTSGQQLCSASSADCQPVLLTSEDSSHPAQHLSSRRRNHYVAQARTTDEDQQSGPVASLPVASSDSGSLSLVRRSSRPFPLQLVFRKSFSQESLPHLSSIFSWTWIICFSLKSFLLERCYAGRRKKRRLSLIAGNKPLAASRFTRSSIKHMARVRDTKLAKGFLPLSRPPEKIGERFAR